MDLRVVRRLVDGQAQQQDQIEERAVRSVVAEFERFDGWYDSAAVAVVAGRAGGFVRATSGSAAALTDAYLTRVVAELVGGSPRAAGPVSTAAPLREGVTSWTGLYGRVTDTVRYQASLGIPLDDAVQAGLQRAESMVRTDLALARRDQAVKSLRGRPGVTGYRRVIHPEASRGGTCGLCIAAADRVYQVINKMALHARCKCTVLAVTKANDPGGTLNDEDLKAVYASAASTKAADLKRVRYQVEQHGELGPVLVDARHRFRGPDDVARDLAA